jgi:hypothetical protein
MAEEKIDGLEGLDDFGDDFGEQLDSFMENEGEDESDSELDSFFEDLSTIDDLEGDEDVQVEEDANDEGNDAAVVKDSSEKSQKSSSDSESEDKPKEKQKKHKKKKHALVGRFPLKAAIISGVTGLILGIITIAMLYFSAEPTDIPEPPPVVKISKPKPKKPAAKPKPKKYSYYVQVVSCISQECVDESRLQLKRLGYKSQVRASKESTKIAEVISTNILSEEDSARYVKKINKKNPLAGHAFRKSVKKGSRISLGLFPDLETANRVRTYLNQAFKKHLFFKIQSTTQKIQYQIVQIGGLKSKTYAQNLRDRLKLNNPDFRGAFVKTVILR